MKDQEVKWDLMHLPNTPLLKGKLPKVAMDYLWEIIEQATIDSKSSREHLAGNITESLYLNDKNNWFFENILKEVCERYVQESPQVVCARNPFEQFEVTKLRLLNFWVNSQRQTEFNPTHNHGGVLSFVIWMKIPTHWEDQYELPFSKGSNTPMASDFQFLYTDIMGNVQGWRAQMSPEIEGIIMVFPSTMIHQVYPFYNCDDDRVSISGNLYYDPKVLEEIRDNEYDDNGNCIKYS